MDVGAPQGFSTRVPTFTNFSSRQGEFSGVSCGTWAVKFCRWRRRLGPPIERVEASCLALADMWPVRAILFEPCVPLRWPSGFAKVWITFRSDSLRFSTSDLRGYTGAPNSDPSWRRCSFSCLRSVSDRPYSCVTLGLPAVCGLNPEAPPAMSFLPGLGSPTG